MGENQCSIEYKMPRKCQKCRLEQCLTQGMRKDFLLTEEQKEQRRKHLEDNRNNTLQRLSTIQSSNDPQTTTNIDPISPSLDEIDRVDSHISLQSFDRPLFCLVINGFRWNR